MRAARWHLGEVAQYAAAPLSGQHISGRTALVCARPRSLPLLDEYPIRAQHRYGADVNVSGMRSRHHGLQLPPKRVATIVPNGTYEPSPSNECASACPGAMWP
jgi:hypothetical protein